MNRKSNNMQVPIFSHYVSWVFMFLFTLSVLRPQAFFGDFGFSTTMLTMGLVALFCVARIHFGPGWRWVWGHYKVELCLLLTYQVICLITLFLNLSRYSSLYEILYFGVSPIAVSSVFPLAFLLFFLPSGKQRFHKSSEIGGWAVIIILVSFACWQLVDFSSSEYVSHYFISSEFVDKYTPERIIDSLLQTTTDLGSLMAIAGVVLIYRLRIASNNLQKLMFTLLLVAVFFIGLSTMSRNFLFSVLAGFSAFTFVYLKSQWRKILVTTVGGIFLFHGLVLVNPLISSGMDDYLPYLGKIFRNESVVLNDFVPQLPVTALSARSQLWDKAVDMWLEKPMMGVSTGGYKLAPDNLSGSLSGPHNFALQILIDSGIVGMLVIVLLFTLLFKRMSPTLWPLIITIFATSTFDFFIDHSVPWSLCVAWLLAICVQIEHYRLLENGNSSKSEVPQGKIANVI